MKKIILLLAVIILSSCSKEDNSIDIEGTWFRTESYAKGNKVIFTKTKVSFYTNEEILIYDAAYKINGDKITLTPSYSNIDYVYTFTSSSGKLVFNAYSNNFVDPYVYPNLSLEK